MSSSSFGRGSLTSTSMAAGAVAAAAIFLFFCSNPRARSRRLRRRASAALAGAATSDELAGLARGAARFYRRERWGRAATLSSPTGSAAAQRWRRSQKRTDKAAETRAKNASEQRSNDDVSSYVQG